jgi:hypothetical protein
MSAFGQTENLMLNPRFTGCDPTETLFTKFAAMHKLGSPQMSLTFADRRIDYSFDRRRCTTASPSERTTLMITKITLRTAIPLSVSAFFHLLAFGALIVSIPEVAHAQCVGRGCLHQRQDMPPGMSVAPPMLQPQGMYQVPQGQTMPPGTQMPPPGPFTCYTQIGPCIVPWPGPCGCIGGDGYYPGQAQ